MIMFMYMDILILFNMNSKFTHIDIRGDVKIPHSQIVQAAACGQQPYILEHPFTDALDGSWLLGGCSLHRGYGVD